MSSDVPRPVVFDLDVAQSARLRAELYVANGGRLFLPVLALGPAINCVTGVLRLQRDGWRDAGDWVLLAIFMSLLALIVLAMWWPRSWQRYFLRPQVATSIAFDDAGLVIGRGDAATSRAPSRVPFEKIRTVRLTPGAVFVLGAVRPVVIIPRAALADGGTQLMTFFAERLVSKRLLRRSALGRTTIVNTASP